MKNLFRIFLCLAAAVASAMAQQSGESKPPSQPSPLGIQPTTEVLVRALLAADSAQSKREKLQAEELKKMIDAEVAKSASQPFAPPIPGLATQIPKSRRVGILTPDDAMVLIDGAVYFKFGGTIYPVNGGGASGCFDPNATVKLQQARVKFAGQRITEQNQKD